MAAQLADIRGRFLHSLNDVPGVRETFAAFEIEAVETSYSIAGRSKAPGKVGEVIISPFPRSP